MRIRKNAKGRPIAMETSITRYELINEQGQRITVDLIGVVHIGEENYYETLNARFEEYEGLLYELVAPEGTVIPKGGRSEAGLNPIAAMQKGMQAVLGLEFQLDHIDYAKENFVHADMTPTEFAESMKESNGCQNRRPGPQRHGARANGAQPTALRFVTIRQDAERHDNQTRQAKKLRGSIAARNKFRDRIRA